MNTFRFVLAVLHLVLLFAAGNGAPVDAKQTANKEKQVAPTLVSNVERDATDTSDSTDGDTTDGADTTDSTDTDNSNDDGSDNSFSDREVKSKAVMSKGTARRSCFPATAVVTLDNGENKKMVDLDIGDRVAVGNGQYSKVFMFTHRLPDVVSEFVQLTAVNGAVLRATEGHYLYVNSKYIAAGDVQVGDLLHLDDGRRAAVASISRVNDAGLFNPQTLHGDIVVNGFQASTYTTFVRPTLAHAALAPMRAVFARLGLVCDALESGLDGLTATA